MHWFDVDFFPYVDAVETTDDEIRLRLGETEHQIDCSGSHTYVDPLELTNALSDLGTRESWGRDWREPLDEIETQTNPKCEGRLLHLGMDQIEIEFPWGLAKTDLEGSPGLRRRMLSQMEETVPGDRTIFVWVDGYWFPEEIVDGGIPGTVISASGSFQTFGEKTLGYRRHAISAGATIDVLGDEIVVSESTTGSGLGHRWDNRLASRLASYGIPVVPSSLPLVDSGRDWLPSLRDQSREMRSETVVSLDPADDHWTLARRPVASRILENEGKVRVGVYSLLVLSALGIWGPLSSLPVLGLILFVELFAIM